MKTSAVRQITKQIGNWLLEKRLNQGLSRDQAAAVGLSAQDLLEIETGKKSISTTHFVALTRLYKVNVFEITDFLNRLGA